VTSNITNRPEGEANVRRQKLVTTLIQLSPGGRKEGRGRKGGRNSTGIKRRENINAARALSAAARLRCAYAFYAAGMRSASRVTWHTRAASAQHRSIK